ncbi:uncharacterized protein DUF2750 [Leptospira meyeri]|uniref:Uncharacterized protein DUF2750 n=1 Tax=Leptospira meyeri TaxID=29508 RepID=A0A4R8MMH2_LEPME|nr:DUF2750 domain-containing protein [Leptospira meyeri]EKJ88160.1 PF11042 family protein [Leptospira meyeri serovar Hardjo str. Went 5]TDY66258.1 uncharacterized protein DUF2750 [Leptospira meyeri]
MSISSIQYKVFYAEILNNSSVWTIKDKNGFPAPKNSEGNRSIPFWSTEKRVKNIIENVSEYSGFEAFEISLEDFMEKWIPGLKKDKLLIGINWSGEKATGYDIKPNELQVNLRKLIKK